MHYFFELGGSRALVLFLFVYIVIFSPKSETLAIRKGIKEGIFQWELQMFSNPLVLPQWRLAILMFREADKVSAGIEILRYT